MKYSLKAWVRYDGQGRIVPGSPIFSASKPKVGNWHEVIQYKCCDTTTTAIPIYRLTLTFNDITNADTLIGGSSSDVALWNAFFDLPTNGNPYTSVIVIGNEVILVDGSNINLKNGVFNSTSSLISIVDTGSIVSLSNNSVSLCVNLITVDLPGVITVSNGCFSGNWSLLTVNFPKVITMETSSFYGCVRLTTINLPNVTTVGYRTFYNCQKLTTLSLPKLLTLGDECFGNCILLTSINLPKLTVISVDCFRYATSLTSINLPNVTTISASAFDHTSLLSSINVPKLTTIGNAAFLACDALTSVYFPLVKTIGSQAFGGCNHLTTIKLSACTNLGLTTGYDFVFTTIGKVIKLTIPHALMTCNGGLPDGDIQYLQLNNTVTVIQV